jgi:hypothetical protein
MELKNPGSRSSHSRIGLQPCGEPGWAFFAVNEREEKESMKRTQASTCRPLDDEEERNMQVWDLWTPEEKKAQREREHLRDSWCPKRVAVVSQERWGVKRRWSSDPY